MILTTIKNLIKKIININKCELFTLKIDEKAQGIFTSYLRCEMYKNGYLHALSEFDIIEDYDSEETISEEGKYTYHIINVSLIKK